MRDFADVGGSQPDVRAFCEQHFGVRLIEKHTVRVPFAPLQEKAVHIGSIFWFEIRLIIKELKIEYDLIDWDCVSSGIVLQHSGQETLSEEEPRNPEHNRDTTVNPLLEESEPCLQVQHIGTQWFKGRIRFAHPELRDFTIE